VARAGERGLHPDTTTTEQCTQLGEPLRHGASLERSLLQHPTIAADDEQTQIPEA
jgi:hypothetical protein